MGILTLLISIAYAEPIPVHFNQAAVAKARLEHKPLYSVAGERVILARQEVPNEVQVHLYESDILVFEEGEADMIVGGTATELYPVGDGEMQGKSILGGRMYHVKKGEVLVIPVQQPHWFKRITKPVEYVVIKQRQHQHSYSRAFYSN